MNQSTKRLISVRATLPGSRRRASVLEGYGRAKT